MMMSVFRKYPVTKSMAAYSLLYPGANCVQQKYVRKSDEIDWTEVGRFLVYGSLVHAPLVYNAMNFISRTFPGTSLPQLLKKVFVDQAFFAPVGLSSFYIGLTALEFKTPSEVYEEWWAKFPKTWQTSICIWPFLQFFNFRFVPFAGRPIFVGVMAFFWTTLLAFWKSQPIVKHEKPEVVRDPK